jgi:hypothetical protein
LGEILHGMLVMPHQLIYTSTSLFLILF